MTAQNANDLISLPKGGGALRGLGETFQADLHTGTGHYRIPIDIPAGRNGLQPQLALTYNSADGNGPFGLGWSLPIPRVTRKTDKRLPRYDASDVFVLSGGEDLVPVAGAASEEQRYRPRAEGLFARIVHHATAGQNYWEVWSRDGLRSRYGTRRPDDAPSTWRDPAIVADAVELRRIQAWYLTETIDPAGNRIAYSYQGDAQEPRSAQRYVTEIRYVDYGEVTNPRYLVSIRFHYGTRPDRLSQRRGGFDVLTSLRCQRIETWTDPGTPVLSRTVNLRYADEGGAGAANTASLLARVTVTGHDGDRTQALPPLEFDYAAWEPARRRYQPLRGPGEAGPPLSLGHGDTDLVDLFGDGLPSVVQINGVARYWRNLGYARFDAPRTMPFVPAGAGLGSPGVQLADMDGDGRIDLLVTDGVRCGYYPLAHDGGFEPSGYVQYRHAPTMNLEDPEVRLVDLDGDGAVDAVRTGTSLELYINDREKSWSAATVRPGRNAYPAPLSDPRVKMADMSGDGLSDWVVVRQGRLQYWPYLGHGRWDVPVTMAGSPRFDDREGGPDGYDPGRVLVGDVDGDGCADVVYVGNGHVTVWINQGGRAFANPVVVRGTPSISDTTGIRLADMLGTGTAGILWTFDAGTQRESTYKFLDLTGATKPYLLASIDNHMGARTTIEYAPSTRYAIADAKAGRPWRTTLPFPVQVVARTTVTEHFSASRMTSEYRYHHGYWDGAEREFRGFARVDQFDAETLQTGANAPVETRTWFHMGPVGPERGSWRDLDLSEEYWPGDPSMLGGTDSRLLPAGLLRRAERDAVRTLAGRVLRTETYARDGVTTRQDRPYTVTEHRYALAPVLDGRPASDSAWQARPVFVARPVAERTTQWERGEQPLTTASFTDGYDEYGRASHSTVVAVPRGRNPRAPGPPGESYLATLTLTAYATRTDSSHYLVDRVARTARYQLVNDGSQSLDQLHAEARDGGAQRQLLGLDLVHYDGLAFEGLAVGHLGEHGIPVRTERLAITAELLGDLCPERPPPYLTGRPTTWPPEYPPEFASAMSTGAGYGWRDDGSGYLAGYYVQENRIRLDLHDDPIGGRGLAIGQRDPLGNASTVTYDIYRLLPVRVIDAAQLATTAQYDYRLLRPGLVADVNGNRSHVSYTPLGLVAAASRLAKSTQREGDTLAQPGTRYEYDLNAWDTSPPSARQPLSVHATSRCEHRWEVVRMEDARRATAGLPPMTDTEIAALFPIDERERFPERFVRSQQYTDGLGRPLQTRSQWDNVVLEQLGLPTNVDDPPGDAVALDRSSSSAPVVAVSGWNTYDNKGRVVRAWEPFLDTGWSYQPPSEEALEHQLASTTIEHDPVGNPVRIVHADGSEERRVRGVPTELATPGAFMPSPWETYDYDANDNGGRTHPGASNSWSGHWNTPATTVVDALGRTVESLARTANETFLTKHRYDIEGRLLISTDPLGRDTSRTVYDLLGRPWTNDLLDAGTTSHVVDAAGGVVERRDAKGAMALTQYDRMRRPFRYWARDRNGEPLTLRGVTLHGDDAASGLTRTAAAGANLLGRAYRSYDEAGVVSDLRFDFAGNSVERTRQVLKTATLLSGLPPPGDAWANRGFKIDWQPAPGVPLEQHARVLLDPTVYATSSRFDALGRRADLVLPADVSGTRRKLRFTFSRSGHPQSIQVDGSAYVRRILHNARGQRSLAVLENGVMVRYAYDPRTFRLARLRSERFTPSGVLAWRSGGRDAVRQDHGYRYDLVGNFLVLADRSPGCGTPPGHPDQLDRAFRYDAAYRLVSASGRECAVAPPDPWSPSPRCTDLTATRPYTEAYSYDPVGNLLRLVRRAGTESWVARATLAVGGNRLQTWSTGATTLNYVSDASGNTVQEATSRLFEWDARNRLATFRVQSQNAEPSLYAHYRYDAGGERIVKIVREQGGRLATTVYIEDCFERLTLSATASTSRHDTVHVFDETARIATVRIGSPPPGDITPPRLYLLPDHLGSSEVVTDATGALVNREEFSPYGLSTFGSYARKRYRFTGKERDEESGLSYHGARYYAPWLCRWVSYDPARVFDDSATARSGTRIPPRDRNRAGRSEPYEYVRSNPIGYRDPSGWEEHESLFNEVAQGDFHTGKTTWTGVAANVGVGLVPVVGQAADLRDTAAAIKKVADEPKSWGNWGQLGMAVVGWVPLLGDGIKGAGKVGKKVVQETGVSALTSVKQLGSDAATSVWEGIDEMAEWVLATRGGVVGKIEKHHVFPQKFKAFFKSFEIDIHEYVVRIDREVHKLAHGKRKIFEDYNTEWAKWIKSNLNATEQEVFEQAGRLMDKYGLSLSPVTDYEKKK